MCIAKALKATLGRENGAHVSRYEKRPRLPPLETALACEAIFGIPVAQLFAGVRRSQKIVKRSSLSPWISQGIRGTKNSLPFLFMVGNLICGGNNGPGLGDLRSCYLEAGPNLRLTLVTASRSYQEATRGNSGQHFDEQYSDPAVPDLGPGERILTAELSLRRITTKVGRQSLVGRCGHVASDSHFSGWKTLLRPTEHKRYGRLIIEATKGRGTRVGDHLDDQSVR